MFVWLWSAFCTGGLFVCVACCGANNRLVFLLRCSGSLRHHAVRDDEPPERVVEGHPRLPSTGAEPRCLFDEVPEITATAVGKILICWLYTGGDVFRIFFVHFF